MRILFVASEGLPFSKTGGLADVVEALPKALVVQGHEVAVVLPRYRGTKATAVVMPSLTIPMGGTRLRFSAIAGKRSRVPPIGIVRLGITTAVAFVPRYRGNTTATSWPCTTSAFGSASTTSARPPVFENGSPSDATNKILTALSLHSPAEGILRQRASIT